MSTNTPKICPRCGKSSPFPRDKYTKDGLSRLCGPCAYAHRRAYHVEVYVPAHREQIRASSRASMARLRAARKEAAARAAETATEDK